jgi:putative holliday junction resolvase
MGYVLGFDFGQRRIGVAVADLEVGVATGLRTIRWESRVDLRKHLDRLIGQYEPVRLVVGDPIPLGGRSEVSTPGRTERSAHEIFMDRLRGWYGLPVTGWDERLTTAAARRVLREAGVGERRARARGGADRMAAVLLLQHWLDTTAAEREQEAASSEPSGAGAQAGESGRERNG